MRFWESSRCPQALTGSVEAILAQPCLLSSGVPLTPSLDQVFPCPSDISWAELLAAGTSKSSLKLFLLSLLSALDTYLALSNLRVSLTHHACNGKLRALRPQWLEALHGHL